MCQIRSFHLNRVDRLKGAPTISSSQINNPEISRVNRLRCALAPALLLCLNLLVFGTYAVYIGNTGEFLVPYFDALKLLLLPGLASVLILCLIAWGLNSRHSVAYCVVLLFLAFITYFHGNLIRWDVGVLDGSALDMARSWRGLVDALIWAVLAWLAWRFRYHLVAQGWKLCSLLALFQVIGLSTQDGKIADSPPNAQVYPEKNSYFSEQNNVIHIILDAFQANVFEYILQSRPQMKDEFSGFTFFRDAVTPSDVTYLSVPATLSGKAYTNDSTISDYHDDTLGGENLYTFLAERNYAIDVATPVWWNQTSNVFSSYYRIPTPYAGNEALRSTALLLLDISLFRQAPHFLKSQIYRNGVWLISNRLLSRPEQQFSHFAHNEFLRDFTERAAIKSERPTYKFIHLVTPHAPLVTDYECGFFGAEQAYSMETFGVQSRCTLESVTAFLRRLKKLGIYNDSLLLIHGDHGGGVAFDMRDADGQASNSSESLHQMWGNPLPLVLVKPPGADGPLRISNNPVSLTDLPATVADLLDTENPFPGRSMFDAVSSEPPVREYHRSTMHRNDAAEKDRFDNFSSFYISGSVYDVAAWSEGKFFQAPATTENEGYIWGVALSFGSRGNFKPFQDEGWTVTRVNDISWTHGYRAGLSIQFPLTTDAVRMSVTLKPFLIRDKLDQQRVTVMVNDHELAYWELTENRFQNKEVLIPAELFIPGETTEFSFILPDAQSPLSLGAGEDNRVLGLAFMSLRFDRVITSE